MHLFLVFFFPPKSTGRQEIFFFNDALRFSGALSPPFISFLGITRSSDQSLLMLFLLPWTPSATVCASVYTEKLCVLIDIRPLSPHATGALLADLSVCKTTSCKKQQIITVFFFCSTPDGRPQSPHNSFFFFLTYS